MNITKNQLRQLITENLNEVLKAQAVSDVDPKEFEEEERFKSFALMIDDFHTSIMDEMEGDFDNKLSLISNAIVSNRERDPAATELENHVRRLLSSHGAEIDTALGELIKQYGVEDVELAALWESPETLEEG